MQITAAHQLSKALIIELSACAISILRLYSRRKNP